VGVTPAAKPIEKGTGILSLAGFRRYDGISGYTLEG